MNNRRLVLESICLIEKHLESDMTISEVAKKIGFSKYYFSHLFKAVTHLSPSTYMTQRKLSDSVEKLLTSNMKIIDIAMLYGYSSSEAYSRAFTKCFTQSPSDVRIKGLIHGGRMMKQFNEFNMMPCRKDPFRKPELVYLDEIHLAGIMFYHNFKIDKNDFSDQWSNLMNHLDMIPSRHEQSSFYQMQIWFEDQKKDAMYFYVGTGIKGLVDLPMQMNYKKIPPGKFIRFYHKGVANTIGKTYQYIYEEWLPSTNYKLPYSFNFEYYGPENQGPYNPESITEIYIPVE